MSILIATEEGLSCADSFTGNVLKSFKQCENVGSGLNLLKSQSSVLSLQRGKPLIHQYHLKKEGVFKRIILPTKMSVLSVSPCGQWIAAGAPNGSLYVWNLASGALQTIANEAHLQSLTCITWTHDSSVLVTGGDDARILLWRLIDLVCIPGTGGQSAPEPKHTWTCHTLPITSLTTGPGTFREARLYSASQDATVTVMDIFSGIILYTLATDTKIHALTVDPAERAVYLGGDDGVHMVPLYFEPANSSKLVAAGSIDGSVLSTNKIERILKPECSTVTALCLSHDSTHIFVGCQDGSVSSWEVGTGQLIRKFRSTKGAATQIIYFEGELKSSDIMDELPVLQRSVEPECLDFVAKCDDSNHPIEQYFEVKESELDEIDEFNLINSKNNVTDHIADKEDEISELVDLKERFAQLQRMYDALWASHAKK